MPIHFSGPFSFNLFNFLEGLHVLSLGGNPVHRFFYQLRREKKLLRRKESTTSRAGNGESQISCKDHFSPAPTLDLPQGARQPASRQSCHVWFRKLNTELYKSMYYRPLIHGRLTYTPTKTSVLKPSPPPGRSCMPPFSRRQPCLLSVLLFCSFFHPVMEFSSKGVRVESGTLSPSGTSTS